MDAVLIGEGATGYKVGRRSKPRIVNLNNISVNRPAFMKPESPPYPLTGFINVTFLEHGFVTILIFLRNFGGYRG